MDRTERNNSTNVRLSIPDAWWAVLADWTVGEIPTPSFDEPTSCPSCGRSSVARDGRCEQCALEHELFHRDERTITG